jgi:ferritin
MLQLTPTQLVLSSAPWQAEEHRSLNHAGTFFISIWQETAFHGYKFALHLQYKEMPTFASLGE